MKRRLTALFALSLGTVLTGLVAADLWQRPIESVRVSGSFVQVSRSALERAIEPYLSKDFLSVNVSSIRGAARTVPWVREVSVRRVWPDRIEIAVSEREAVARWRERALLESDGALFSPPGLDGGSALPALTGPPGRHREVLDRWRVLDRLMLARLGSRVTSLETDVHGGWRAGLANGISLRFGSDPLAPRVARYVHAFPKVLGSRLAEVREIDLRYGHGFSVRWRDGEDADEERNS